eukprot:XP_017945980.1 PREDICTED: scavenger receptor cysteine-rich type 1 protein M130-like [Xenopus tropicalis]
MTMLLLCYLFVGLKMGTANKTDPVSVRLGAKNRPCEGAVEIKTQSEWLPLCKDSLDVALSVPICNALHCGKPKDPNPSYTEAFTNSSAHVAIHCSAANESLSQCALSYLPPGNCSGPAMISCQGNSSSSEQSLSSCALKYLCGPGH